MIEIQSANGNRKFLYFPNESTFIIIKLSIFLYKLVIIFYYNKYYSSKNIYCYFINIKFSLISSNSFKISYFIKYLLISSVFCIMVGDGNVLNYWRFLIITAGVCVIESSASTVTSSISVPKTDLTLWIVFISVESDF